MAILAVLGVLAALGLKGARETYKGSHERLFWAGGMRRAQGEGAAGREEGAWSYWYKNGQLREEGTYKEGRRVGTWSQWFQNGQRSSSGERVWSAEDRASVKHGPWRTWHENGDPSSQGAYEMGARVGDWQFWRLQGDRVVLDEERSGRYEADRKVQ